MRFVALIKSLARRGITGLFGALGNSSSESAIQPQTATLARIIEQRHQVWCLYGLPHAANHRIKMTHFQQRSLNTMRMHLHNLAFLTTLAIGVALGQTASNPQQIPSQKPGNQLQPAQQAKASADIQNDIQSALQKDPSLAKANISVQVTEQNVELSGTVPTREAKNTAEQIARTHSGGLEVKNNLRVGDSN